MKTGLVCDTWSTEELTGFSGVETEWMPSVVR